MIESIVRGTTPTHNFNLPIDTSELKTARVIYSQNDKIVFKKERDECKMEGNTVSVTLTQAETFSLDHKHTAQVQIRILTTDGKCPKTKVYDVPVERCLDDEVLE